MALVHLLADRIHSRNPKTRDRRLSFAGGASVAFVLMHLIPELAARQQALEAEGILAGFLEDHLYLAALTGMVIYYGAEHAERVEGGTAGRAAKPLSGVRGGRRGLQGLMLVV